MVGTGCRSRPRLERGVLQTSLQVVEVLGLLEHDVVPEQQFFEENPVAGWELSWADS